MDDRKTVVRTPSPQKQAAPRLPHERDESDDSQARRSDPKMHQAHADLAAGLTDTDCRGTPGVEAAVHGSTDGKPWCPAAPGGGDERPSAAPPPAAAKRAP